MMVQLCVELLVEAGYQAHAICGSRQALACLDELRFDLLLVDLKMPGVNGLTLWRKARELNPTSALVIMTSYGTMENAIEALRAGARDFLLKPFDPEDLVRTVGNALEALHREQDAKHLHSRLAILEQTLQQRREAEETLRQSEERFRVALDGSPIVVFTHDADLRYTWAYNPDPAFGYSAEDMVGATDIELLGPERAAELVQVKRRVLETGVGARQEVMVPLEEGPRFYDLCVEPLQHETGGVEGLACAATDVTEHKRTEEAALNRGAS